MLESIPIVLRCSASIAPKAAYVLDTLLMAVGLPAEYRESPPERGAWILYGHEREHGRASDRCVAIAHIPAAWEFLRMHCELPLRQHHSAVPALFPQQLSDFTSPRDISFDLIANAFYLLTSWPERIETGERVSRQMFRNSIFARARLPQNVVDVYAGVLRRNVARCRHAVDIHEPGLWPGSAEFALVLSHDVDYLSGGLVDEVLQAVKTFARHAFRERALRDAVRAAAGFFIALLQRRDPFGCVPEIIARETRLGVRSSFQVAVARRHPLDVNYRIEDERIRDYLQVIPRAGFDLCLHGSYRSTENPGWYQEECDLLASRLVRPLGSRQHYLSFYYDSLFAAQEAAGIEYDMSMGYADHVGSRVGFSYPYFPYCLQEDRPYNVLQIGLVLMDVTLRNYMGLHRDPEAAWAVAKGQVDSLKAARGCASVVWHPIVFGGATLYAVMTT